MDHDSISISRAITKLDTNNLLAEIGNTSITLIDDYFRRSGDDSIFDEPGFKKTQEFRVFLMSEKLGKDDQYSPVLKAQINYARRDFRRNPQSDIIKALLLGDN